MTILIDHHSFHYEMENLCRVFYPNEKMKVQHGEEFQEREPLAVYTGRHSTQQGEVIQVRLYREEACLEAEALLPPDTPELEEECERRMAVLLYGLLVRQTGITPPWGILTGVRPIKLMRRLLNAGGEQYARAYFTDRLLVSPSKTELSVVTMQAEQKLLELSCPDSFSLYVSIPFCPTRCAYCSFVSQTVERAAKLIPDYVRLLCRELEETGAIAKALGLRLETVYIGGGTPTTLTAEQLALLISTIRANFDLSHCREFTIEAGRPDTITVERLRAMRAGGVDRISINPQTLNDHVLEVIGRKHTARQTLEAFRLAREEGFAHINMDLIAGLPEDTSESFARTLRQICELEPESITIHTLAMKKSSALTLQGMELYREECQETERMLEDAGKLLPLKQYFPYYLYRQSRMVGNLENVGWAKPGYEGLYNVYVMDETHTVLACGAGAVTKLKQPGGEFLERIFNFKYPYEYNTRFEELLNRKQNILDFYRRYGIPGSEDGI